MDHKPGTKKLLDIIEDVACHDPHRCFAQVPKGVDGRDGYRTVSMADLRNAIAKTSEFLQHHIPSANPITFAYAGPQDLRYVFMVLAAAKLGHMAFLPSLRNSAEAHIRLFDAYDCSALFVAEGSQVRYSLNGLLTARIIRIIETPETNQFLSEVVDKRRKRPGRTKKPSTGSKATPLVALQTSGSTGSPKPIIMPQQCLMAVDAYRRLSDMGFPPVLFSRFRGKRMLLAFPLFHAAGLTHTLHGILYQYTVVFLPPSPITADAVIEIVDRLSVDIAFIPPSIVEDIANNERQLQVLEKLSYLLFGGGPLTEQSGDKVCARVHTATVYGTSELGLLPLEENKSDCWQYLRLSRVAGAEMKPFEGQFAELVVRRSHSLSIFQTRLFDDGDSGEFRTGDLFSEHPTNKGLWQFRGRRDDIIVFSTGEKFNPIDMEAALQEISGVKSAIISGTGRPRSALIIEPDPVHVNGVAKGGILAKVRHSLCSLRENFPGHARIIPENIVIAPAEKPFLRAGKGTIQRQMTIALFKDELDALYRRNEGHSVFALPIISKHKMSDDVTQSFEQVIRIALGHVGLDIPCLELDSNFFDAGLDSVGVVQLVRQLQGSSSSNHRLHSLKAADIYHNASLRTLIQHLEGRYEYMGSEIKRMQALYEQHTHGMGVGLGRRSMSGRAAGRNVLLTGSSGSLGSQILDRLLRDERTEKIFCLTRTQEACQKQRSLMGQKGLNTDFDCKPVLFLNTDFAQPNIGLSENLYSFLLDEVIEIVHCAWELHFNFPVEHFARSHINGVRQIIDLSVQSRRKPSIIFISSISTVMRWEEATGDLRSGIPEAPAPDWKAAEPIGYAQSKLIAERMLERASSESGVPTIICRVGQITGPTNIPSAWPKHEWLPSLIATSKFLGYLPSSLGLNEIIDWMPVDTVARIVLELQREGRFQEECQIFHVVNPKKTSWSAILPALKDRMALKDVALPEWIRMVASSNVKDTGQNPAAKLLDFFQGIATLSRRTVPFDASRACQCSPTLQHLRNTKRDFRDDLLQHIAC